MLFALVVLVSLIFATPITVIFDGLITQGLVAAVAAVSLAIVAARIRLGEAAFLSTVVGPAVAVAAIPAIWMLIQLIPLQGMGLANPIWKSASAALGQPIAGSISIDPGATLISFIRYLSAMAIAFVSAAVAIDRRRAEWILFALLAAATLCALISLTSNLGILTFSRSGDGGQIELVASTVAGFGTIFALVDMLHVFEHKRAQRPDLVNSTRRLIFASSLAVVCLLAIIVDAASQPYFTVVCGIATIAIVVIVRRFGLGLWGIAAVISMALFVVFAVFAFRLGGRTVGLTTAFATQAPEHLVAVTQRILAETGWAGTGAGTFSAMLPIYQDMNELAIGQLAPTAAAAVAIELGRPFFLAILVGVIALVFILLRGALRRQRDSFYSAAGASCAVTITFLSFGNSVILSTPALIVIAAGLGIGIAQSKSRLV